MADLGVETSQQMERRKRVVCLAFLIETFFDCFTYPFDGFQVRGPKFNGFIKRLFNRLRQEITKLRDEPHHMDSLSLPPSAPSYSTKGGYEYDPCLPGPGVEAELIGIGGAREKLTRLLLDGEKQRKTVSIVGFAGVGKTTLAMEIYGRTKDKFECHARATVSPNPDMKQLLQHVLSQVRQNLNLPECSEMSPEVEHLIAEVGEHLQYKRYIILLDDMWESSTEIMRALPENNCGSRIIITTRIKLVAYGTMYEMERLGLVESENLLSREIYGSNDGCPDVWRQESFDTAKTYDGVPLATIAIARLVKEKLNNPHICPEVQMSEMDRADERILLSYIDLDPCFKAHMMLLCMFPWNFQIERNLIIRVWRAEGYANSGSRSELTAEGILDELINLNVILPVNHDDISQVEAWKVYYGMYEHILWHSAQENFLITSSKLQLATAKMFRRLALHSYNQRLESMLRQLDLSFISSLSIFWKANRVSLHKFGNLRVLDILGWEHLNDNDLKHICNMVLLRYLSIRNTSVKTIPNNIINLRLLETFDLRKTLVTTLPILVGQLPKLSDLLVGNDQDPTSNSRVKIPTGFQCFPCLKTLETIHLSDACFLLDSLQHLTEVTIMCPFEESCYSHKKLRGLLKQCRELKSLTFYGGLGCSMEFLHSLHDPPRELRKLRVTGLFVTIPQWIPTLENLVFLQLKVCKPDHLHNLSKLRRLQHLLLGLDFLLKEHIVITGFPALQRFSVDCRAPWLNFQPRAMQKLTKLELKFREGPANQNCFPSGIYHLTNLKRVAIYYSSYCQSSPSVKAIVEAIVTAVREHPGPVKLVINGSTGA